MSNSTSRRRLLAVSCATIFFPPLAPAAVVTWAVDADGAWTTAANWSSNPALPGAADDVTINRPAGDFLVTLSSGTQTINSLTSNERLTLAGGTLNLNVGSTVANTFTLAGGTLGGTGALTLTSAATLDNGTLTSTVVGTATNFSAGLTITGAAGKSLFRRTLTNSATTTWNAGGVSNGFEATFVNAPGAIFNNTFDGNWFFNLGGGAPSFINQGTFNKTAGAAATAFSTNFDNSGTVNVNSGTLQFLRGGIQTGLFNIAALATLDFNSGTHNLNAGTTFTGAGTAAVTAGTTSVNAPVTVSSLFSLAGGTVSGTGALTLAAASQWSRGTFTGTGSTTFSAPLTIGTAGAKSLTQRTLTNNSTTTWSAGGVSNGFAANFVNAPGATFNNTFDGNWFFNLGGGAPSFTNQGTFNKTAGAAATVFSTAFNNTGTVNVNSGTLQLVGSGTNSGAIALAANSTFQINGGTYNLAAGTTITGPNSAAASVINGTLAVNAAMTLDAPLHLNGGIVTGTTALTLTDPATWSAGTFTGTGSTTFNGTLSIDTTAAKALTQRTLVNTTTTTWSAGGVSTGFLANFVNAPGATFNNTFDGNWFFNLGGGASTFTNQGTFNKTAGAGTTSISAVFNNTGTVNVNSGTLQLAGNGTNSAALNVAANANLHFASTAYALGAGTTLAGAGAAAITTGTLNVTAPVTITVASFDYLAGTHDGAFNVTHSSPTTWTGTTLRGAATTTFNAPFNIQTSASKSLLQRQLVNNSTTTWSGGGVSTGFVATFTNAPGATFNNTFDGNWFYNLGGGLSSFINQGTFTKSAGAGTTNISSLFENTGTVNVSTGTLELSGGSNHASTVNVAAAATLELSDRPHNLNAGATVAGAGTAALTSAATLTVNAPVTLTVASVNFTAGIQNGPGALTLTGTSNWNGTQFTGAGATTFNGPLLITSNTSRSLTQRTLTAAGATTWSAGGVSTGTSAAFVNAPTGTFNNTFDGNWFYNLGGGMSSFTNQGTFTKSAGAGTTTVTATFSNTGTVNANAGTLSLTAVAQHVGNSLTAGTWNVNGATLLFPNGVDIVTLNAGAAVALSGPASVFARINPLSNNQGSFTVTNGRNFATAGPLTNSGTLTAGLNSTLAVNGNLDNTGTVSASPGNLTATSATQLSGTTLTGGTWVATNGTLTISTGSNVTTIGPAATVFLVGATSIFAKIDPVATVQGRLSISEGRKFTTAGPLTNSGIIGIGTNATLKVAGTLNNTGTVDLAPGTLLLDYTGASPINTLRAQLLTGRAGGVWTGTGVRSSTAAAHPQLLTAIGYAEASALLGLTGAATATYAGLTVDATTVLTKFTYYGDTDLSGRVDRDDLARADRGLAMGLTGWLNGDFDYNNIINAADFILLDRSLILQGPPLSPDLLAARTATFGPTYVPNLLASLTVTPEPTLLLPTLLTPLLLPRPRRRTPTT